MFELGNRDRLIRLKPVQGFPLPAEERRINLGAARIQYRGDQHLLSPKLESERLQGRNTDTWFSQRMRHPLDRRKPDPQPGKRTGAGRDREQVDLRKRGMGLVEQVLHHRQDGL